jgi:prepilin-type N-terminal cleavage/methylation domain-containing protein
MRGRVDQRTRADGFTLIEMIAVVLILGLAMSLVVPNLSATRVNRLRDQARKVAHQLEMARQRAITSGVPHRVYIDLEEGFFRVDWWVDEATAYPELEEEEEEAVEPLLDADGNPIEDEIDLSGPIPMSPPTGDEPDFFPINHKFGRNTYLQDDYYFVGVDTESGWYESGAVEVVFGADGVAEYSEIRLADAWDNVVVLEVEPLIELIRIREVTRE